MAKKKTDEVQPLAEVPTPYDALLADLFTILLHERDTRGALTLVSLRIAEEPYAGLGVQFAELKQRLTTFPKPPGGQIPPEEPTAPEEPAKNVEGIVTTLPTTDPPVEAEPDQPVTDPAA